MREVQGYLGCPGKFIWKKRKFQKHICSKVCRSVLFKTRNREQNRSVFGFLNQENARKRLVSVLLKSGKRIKAVGRCSEKSGLYE